MNSAFYEISTGKITRQFSGPAEMVADQCQAGEEFFLNCPVTATHIIDNEPATITPVPTQAEIIAALTTAVNDYYDSVAQKKLYDNHITCALRAGYPGPYQAEGQAFGAWMDTCNEYGYQVQADCVAGKRTTPTAAELIAELPAMVWPIDNVAK